MSYQIEQEVKGKTYVYLVESYWDSEKQQSRQKRTYLGRKDEKTGKIIDTKKTSLPKSSHAFGGVFLLRQLIKELKLDQILKEVFPFTYEKYLYLAMFKILTAEAYYLYPHWKDASYLPDNAELDSQGISTLFKELGENEKTIEAFFNSWIEANNAKKSIMFDITSLSSYSENNSLLEYGHNRDRETLEQVNIGVISKEIDSSMHIPLAYRIYPGSISDVTTLENILELIKHYKLVLSSCVMDRGFYSLENIKSLHEKGLKYLIPVPFSTRLAKDTATQYHQEVSSSLNSFTFRNAVYFHYSNKITLEDIRCTLHVFLDKEKKSREENKLMKKISEVELTFKNKNFKTIELAEQYIIETLKSKKKFFIVKKKNKAFLISRNKKVIDQEITQLGMFIIITNQNSLDKINILENYRNKDGVEKIFQSFKQDIHEKRSRTKSAETMKGSFFVSFLALIILSRITQVMTHKELFKSFTKAELLKTISALKVFQLNNGISLLAENTKKQKNIFSAFNLKLSKPSYNLTGF